MGCSGSSLHEPATIAPPPSNQDDHHDNTNNSGVDGGEVKGEKKEESSLEKPKTVNQQKPPMSSEQAGTETATQSSAHKERETIDASQDGSKSKEPKLSPEKTKITNNAKIPNMEHKTTEKEPEVSENRKRKEKDELAHENLELDQQKFSATLNKLCLCVDAENFISQIPINVRKLGLNRAPPHTLSVTSLLSRLSNLQELDVSNNHLGPQAFRLLMLALASNTSLLYLNAANNGADTDSAVCVGRLLSSNKSLSHLDVSGNHLGKDYLSRCVGPALKTNQTLQTLRLESVGATDMNDLLEGLAENSSIRDLNICNNEIYDRESVGVGLAKCLKKQDCALRCINVKNCHMSSGGVESLREGLSVNKSLLELDISGNEFATLDCLMRFLITCFHCTALIQLSADITKIKGDNLTGEEIPVTTEESCLRTLSLSNCGLTPEFISTLERMMKGKLLHLNDLNLSDNPALKASCLKMVATVTSGLSGQSSLTRLTFGLNDAENIHEFINPGSLPCLEYLNFRKAKISAASVGKLHLLTAPPSGCLKTLVLDGLKLAGTEALQSLLAKPTECSLVALSLSGCQLSDLDITPLTSALKAALPLHMLKLSANRITDKGVTDLVSCLVSQKEHPLAVLDLSNNQIGSEGATALSSLFMSDNHKSYLHSLNLSHNNIGKEGLQTVMRCVGRPLKTVYLNNQRGGLEEGPVADILTELATAMDYVLESDATGKLKEGSCQIINTDTIYVNLSNLGGHCGEVGRLLDCGSVVTDYRQKQVTSLALSHVCQLAAALRNSETDHVVLSSQEWDLITGCKKDREIPSWLQLAECRERAVYLTNLPGTTTVRRLEGLFEEEDCNVEEICLLKDAVSRKMNGLAWALMSDKESVSRLIDYFHRGEAQVFGQPFLICPLLVTVDDAASEEIAKQARQDVERRARERQSDDATHRSLIRESAEESWKRHAYRLAHPAYADGRVW